MATKNSPQSDYSGRDSEVDPSVPYVIKRTDANIMEFQRRDSGGLDDDPTASGSPVIDAVPYKNLRGGR